MTAIKSFDFLLSKDGERVAEFPDQNEFLGKFGRARTSNQKENRVKLLGPPEIQHRPQR